MLGTLVLCLIGTTWAQLDLADSGISLGDSSDLLGGIAARDSEPLPAGPLKFGTKYMTGGAGEGDQQLTEDGEYKHRAEVKSDNVLPAYCEPPNPCPVGYTAEHGCLEEFENSAEFSREYQAGQHCICDQEHMFNCAKDEASDSADNLQSMLEDDEHQAMIAKKFHEKRGGESFIPRKKRSIDPAHHAPNPYLQGEPLRSMQKKDGRKSSWSH